MGGGVNARAVQPTPILLFTEMVPDVLQVNLGSPRSPTEQSAEGNNNGRCNWNQHPPVHAAPSTKALPRLVAGAPASTNSLKKTISESGTISHFELYWGHVREAIY